MSPSKFQLIYNLYSDVLNEAKKMPKLRQPEEKKDAAMPPGEDGVDPELAKMVGGVEGETPEEGEANPEEESMLPDSPAAPEMEQDRDIPPTRKVPILRSLRRALLIKLEDPQDETILNDLGEINETDIEQAETTINNIIDKYSTSNIDI